MIDHHQDVVLNTPAAIVFIVFSEVAAINCNNIASHRTKEQVDLMMALTLRRVLEGGDTVIKPRSSVVLDFFFMMTSSLLSNNRQICHTKEDLNIVSIV